MAQNENLGELSIHEKLEKVGSVKSIKDKVKLLQQYDTLGLRLVLRGAYDPTIKWLLPSTRPPFELNEAVEWDLADARLDTEIFDKGVLWMKRLKDGKWFDGKPNVTQVKREQIFIQMIESLHSTEVDVVFGMLKRKLPYSGVTTKLVLQAFPNLYPEGDAPK